MGFRGSVVAQPNPGQVVEHGQLPSHRPSNRSSARSVAGCDHLPQPVVQHDHLPTPQRVEGIAHGRRRLPRGNEWMSHGCVSQSHGQTSEIWHASRRWTRPGAESPRS